MVLRYIEERPYTFQVNRQNLQYERMSTKTEAIQTEN